MDNKRKKLHLSFSTDDEQDEPNKTHLPRLLLTTPSDEGLPYVDDADAIDDYPYPTRTNSDRGGVNFSIGSEHTDESNTESVEKSIGNITPLPENPLGFQYNSRRNSISLPDLKIFELARLHGASGVIPEQSVGSTYSGGDASIEDLNEILAEEDCVKIPLRHGPRRKSVIPPATRRAMASNGKDKEQQQFTTFEPPPDDDSPVNSITSINSLASLLKEKIQSIPTKIRKQPADYKIRAFVGFLFLCIVFFVGFAYVMYHQQVLARAYFDKIKFNKVKRVIRIFNKDDTEILVGRIGKTISPGKAYDCLADDLLADGSICLEWLNSGRLYLNSFVALEGDDIRCYTVRWQALREGVYPTDCYDWSGSQGHWYGAGLSANHSWPLEMTSHGFAPFVTGDTKKHQWGNVLMRYFISSKGTAIIIDERTPLYVSINDRNNNELCLQSKFDTFAFVRQGDFLPELSYKICTSTNIKTLHSSLSSRSLWDGLKQEDINSLHSLLSEPVWEIAPKLKEDLTEATVYNYTEDVIALGFLKQGHVLINEFWQDQIGDFTLDTTRFETLDQTVNIMHRRGFKIVFAIQPFISTESANFAECVSERLLISERFSDRRIPALTRYKSVASAGVLDITSNRTIPWLHEKLKTVKESYQIDAFYLDLGTAHNMPHYFQCEKKLNNPDEYKTLFIESFERTTNLIGVSSAIALPRPPTFVSLPPFESSWKAIKMVIPTILSYGVIGYPFLMPGAVGGDIDWPGNEQYIPTYPRMPLEQTLNITQENGILLPEKELYMRWLQLATFLPVMKFTHLPSKYNDEHVLEVAKILTALRQKTVTPLLLKYTEQALDAGLPLIRPLWMLSPNDPACHIVADEFSVGDELIVAPVLDKGVIHREVYLPAGVWKDGIDGSLRKGSRWMHDYKVPTDKVAFFVKMPDNTRF